MRVVSFKFEIDLSSIKRHRIYINLYFFLYRQEKEKKKKRDWLLALSSTKVRPSYNLDDL